jgi:GT2 family glycosyltransferase/glycosyltransferase involved in cell wall biosynthesis
MRILLVCDFPDDPTLGSAKVPHELRKAFRQVGHHCDALFANDLGSWPRQRHARDLLAPSLADRAIQRAFDANGPYDIVDVAGAEGAAFQTLRARGNCAGSAFVSRSNGLEHLNYARLLHDAREGLVSKPWPRRLWYPAIRLRQVRRAIAASDRLILLNEQDRAFVVARGWKSPDAIDVIGHGLSDGFVPPPSDAPRGAGVLFCGSWDPVKGGPYLAAAWRMLAADGGAPPLTILGGGRPAAAILEDFDPACRHAVTVLDRAAEDEVLRQYRRHDLLVMCSTYEGYGLVVPEAMSQRLPVVATPVGVAASLVRDGETGLVVPPRDPAAIARAVRRLIHDAAARARLADAAVEAVGGMSWSAAARRTLDAYHQARVRGGTSDAASARHTTPRRAISVGITTRNRQQSLNACVASLALAVDLIEDVFVFDDASEPAATVTAPPALTGRVAVLRDASAPGYIVGRNRLIQRASAPFVLLLDDDTRILNRESILAALDVMRADASIAAVGFAQAEADGRPWPAAMQPAAAHYPCFVPSFIGFAHLLRRDVALAIGGYRDSLRFYGEEKEFCLRLLDAGYRVAYLPGARVSHLVDPAGRDDTRRLRYVIRNDCLSALYNEPLTRLMWLIPARLALYFRMRHAGKIADRGGVFWILRELASQLADVRRHRRPVKRSTIRRWRALRASPPPLPDVQGADAR